jgi:hypothetical protein
MRYVFITFILFARLGNNIYLHISFKVTKLRNYAVRNYTIQRLGRNYNGKLICWILGILKPVMWKAANPLRFSTYEYITTNMITKQAEMLRLETIQ